MDYKITTRMYNEHGTLEKIETFKQGKRETIRFMLSSLANDGVVDKVLRIDTQAMRLVEQVIEFKMGQLTMTDKKGEL